MHLPGKITYKEIDEMIKTVDKNEDWKISYSEFRVRFIQDWKFMALWAPCFNVLSLYTLTEFKSQINILCVEISYSEFRVRFIQDVDV